MSYHVLTKERPSQEAINLKARQLFNIMDTDHDGIINKQEFLNYVLKTRKNGLVGHFKKFLDPQDFRALVDSTSENETRYLVDKIFAAVDADDN